MATSILDEVSHDEFDAELYQAANWYLNSEAHRSAFEVPESAEANGESGTSADNVLPRAEMRCPQIKFQRLGEIESEPTAWLSADRFPLGTLTVLAGPSGAGKTFLALDLAAQVTRGACWPKIGPRGEESGDKSPHYKNGESGDESPQSKVAGSVVVMNAKDSTTQVLRPRLDAAGADVERVSVISRANHLPPCAAGNSDPSAVARRLNALNAAIVDTVDCQLAVVDDLDTWMGEFGFASPASHVCAFLDQLAEMAARTQTAIVCLARLSATPEGRIAYRELTNPLKSAQVVWLVADDHERSGRKVLLPVKNNLAPQTRGLGFRLEPAPSGAAVVVWDEEPLSVTAAEVMAPGAGWVERRRDQDVAAEWLLTALDGGRIASGDLFRQAAECGIAVKTLRRAAAQLGIKPCKEGFQGRWFWSAEDVAVRGSWDEGVRGSGDEEVKESWDEERRKEEGGRMDGEVNAKCEMQDAKCKLKNDESENGHFGRKSSRPGRRAVKSHGECKMRDDEAKDGQSGRQSSQAGRRNDEEVRGSWDEEIRGNDGGRERRKDEGVGMDAQANTNCKLKNGESEDGPLGPKVCDLESGGQEPP